MEHVTTQKGDETKIGDVVQEESQEGNLISQQ